MNKLLYVLLIFLISCSPNDDKKARELMDILSANDEMLHSPSPGEWLYEHKEKGQTFKEYLLCSPVTPSDSLNIIYLQPIGDFDSLKLSLIQYTAEYLQILYGCKTKVLRTLNNSIVPDSAKRIGRDGNEQLLAPYILNEVLKKSIPKKAIAYMAITEKDLYPKPSWNFVFGLATYKARVGVTSMYRFADYGMDSTNYRICLRRLIKTSSHEIGHMFSIHHCTHALCAMNGTNHIAETDSKPNRFCSECTAKVIWNFKLDTLNRLKQLHSYFSKYKLTDDDDRIMADIQLLGKEGYK
jgi:archaemetzincin